MSIEQNFEIIPLNPTPEVVPESQPFFGSHPGAEQEYEFERGGRFVRPSPRAGFAPKQSTSFRPSGRQIVSSKTKPHPGKAYAPAKLRGGKQHGYPPHGPLRPIGIRPIDVLVREPYVPDVEPFPGDSLPVSGTENIRWAQDCLNHVMGLRLAVNGIMGADTRSALREFQRQQRLRISGILGPDTVEALKTACRDNEALTEAETELYLEAEIPAGITEAARAAILRTVPGFQLPAATYTSLGHLNRVSTYINTPQRRLGPGLYLIAFTDKNGKRRAYSGETEDLGERLLEHRRCAVMLGMPPSNYEIYIVQLPATQVNARQRRTMERSIHARMRSMPGRVLTNRNLELEEQELLGWR